MWNGFAWQCVDETLYSRQHTRVRHKRLNDHRHIAHAGEPTGLAAISSPSAQPQIAIAA